MTHKTHSPIQNTLCLIRSVGERTTSWCEHLLKQVFPADHVQRIGEVPFSATVRKGFELGGDSGLKWTLCIDADVLPNPDGVRELIQFAETAEEQVFEVHGVILDKYIPCKRPAGNHLYRNALVDKAIGLIPEEGTAKRPESATKKAMAKEGFPWYQTSVYMGLHDFEQYYADIYRKAFLHAVKHRKALPLVEKYWRNRKSDDLDYEIALAGALAGKIYDGTVFVDKRFLEEESLSVLKAKNIQEKVSLTDLKSSARLVEDIESSFAIDPVVQQKQWPRYQESFLRGVPLSKHKQLTKHALKRLGSLMIASGTHLKQLAKDIH
ncbi:hypothetical protein [Tunicatimonas pelagia]|uniref:hypothetical protein n=1 Tax=Tunicatimonas pelagia TaxID=931531 RepID=UPI00266719AF|nr:hypothetical protein [Tunicatimonas pelagia]WKN41789.1 hypothetical protein P0M28_22380 [Tunicatimonas pelagia]